MMEWAMRDEHFKTQLFRFVDVLPALTSSAEVSRHLKEYHRYRPGRPLPCPARRFKGRRRRFLLFGACVIAGYWDGRQFMLGDEPKESAPL